MREGEKDRGWYNCKVIHLNRHPEKEATDNVSILDIHNDW